jgi:hypothetical protein
MMMMMMRPPGIKGCGPPSSHCGPIPTELNTGGTSTGKDIDDPDEARKVELLSRSRELHMLFHDVLRGKPLTCFHSSHLWMLTVLVETWRELASSDAVPAELTPPPPDAEEHPWLAARRTDGYFWKSRQVGPMSSPRWEHIDRHSRIIPDPD